MAVDPIVVETSLKKTNVNLMMELGEKSGSFKTLVYNAWELCGNSFNS